MTYSKTIPSLHVIKTILADDQHIFIEGLKTVLKKRSDFYFEITGIAVNGEDLLKMVCQSPPDLLILDLNLPGKDGLQVLEEIRPASRTFKVLTLSRYDDPKIVKAAFKAGVNGYILKHQSVEELFKAVEEIFDGNTYIGHGVELHDLGQPAAQEKKQKNRFLKEDRFVKKFNLTKRELEILRLITQAMSNKEIARELFISDQTVSVHRKNIMRKLGVSNTAGLLKAAFENSLV